MKLDNLNDSELVMLSNEDNEEAKNILFNKYGYIIDVILKKDAEIIKKLYLDYNDIRSEAMYAFSDAITRYNEKDASLATFISVCVNRKIMNFIRKNSTIKSNIEKNNYSLDYFYETFDVPLGELVEDKTYEPLNKITDNESYNNLIKEIKKTLSKSELEVLEYMLDGLKYDEIAKVLSKSNKQIDNTIQRIRNKIRIILTNV